MIEIIKEISSTGTPYFKLSIDYMLGDSYGDSTLSMTFEVDDKKTLESIEKFMVILRKLKKPVRHWAFSLNYKDFKKNLNEGNISSDEFYWLCHVSGLNWTLEGETSFDEDTDSLFEEIIEDEIGSTYATFQSVYLEYFDEKGRSFPTKIVDTKF
jgi:hypothetical protein